MWQRKFQVDYRDIVAGLTEQYKSGRILTTCLILILRVEIFLSVYNYVNENEYTQSVVYVRV